MRKWLKRIFNAGRILLDLHNHLEDYKRFFKDNEKILKDNGIYGRATKLINRSRFLVGEIEELIKK